MIEDMDCFHFLTSLNAALPAPLVWASQHPSRAFPTEIPVGGRTLVAHPSLQAAMPAAVLQPFPADLLIISSFAGDTSLITPATENLSAFIGYLYFFFY